MHDPHRVAFEIPNYFLKKSKFGYREPFLTVWHYDPEVFGNDDSCDTAYRRHKEYRHDRWENRTIEFIKTRRGNRRALALAEEAPPVDFIPIT